MVVEAGLIELVKWYREMGVDMPVGEQGADWFALQVLGRPQLVTPPRPPAAPPAGSTPHPTSVARAAPGVVRPQARRGSADSDAVMQAREQARRAKTLDELREVLAAFEGCPLKRTAKSLCFADGRPDAPVMIIGEAPGRDEDISGRPFVGRAGQLLDRMLAAINLSREENVYITNTVFWRPPGNRTPAPQETQVCRPFLERQIALLQPRIVVLLGGAAAKTLYNTTQGIMRLRGRWRDLSLTDTDDGPAENGAAGARYPSIATLHPAYLLRNPAAKPLIWKDLLSIEAALSRSD